MAEEKLVNRVARSPLVTINLEEYWPDHQIETLDLKTYLFKGLILKEKDFRQAMDELDWSQYQDKVLCVTNSADAIIPVWAYMLVAAKTSGIVFEIHFGSQESYLQTYYKKRLSLEDWSKYENGLIVIKGCSNKPVPASAYMELTSLLKPFLRSLMYGEPCSTVPIYKRAKKS